MSEQRSTSVPAIEVRSSSSGRTSKDTSPVRTTRKTSTADREKVQNSNTNVSPARPANGASSGTSSTPSALAVQRALSIAKSASTNNDSSSDVARERRQRSGPNTPQWPTSPRLKSPPPVSARSIIGRKIDSEQSQSNTTVRRLAPVSSAELGAAMQIPQDPSRESSTNQSSLRPPGRGASAQVTGLETVAEGSLPSTPSFGPISVHDENSKLQVPALERRTDTHTDVSSNKDVTSNNTSEPTVRTVLEKAETAPSSRATSTSRPAPNLAKRSLTSLTSTGKGKPAVEPLRTITLETEPVTSMSQIITDRGRDGGSVRTKPSTETIRPKKERKKPSRKAPSLHAGMNSSKADIFEAKVASAVDEADSSDSDETFVYESNPPEPRHNRHHSRTPSANSIVSQIDQYGGRGKHGVRSNSTAVGGKKSMKFSNSIHGNQLEMEHTGDGRGSTRTTSSTPRHHHINRHGRNGHASIIDTDSPFSQANRGQSPRTPTARNSRPSSPRTSNGRLQVSRKSAAAGYDVYDDGADDERAPLIGSVRVNRNRHSRRPNSSHFRPLHFAEDEDPGCWQRFGGCFFLGIVITLVCVGVAAFVVLLNRPLADVEILHIQNVLASEQELMLDLHVQAVNTNIFTITVNDLDINLFAESAYVGTTLEWQRYSNRLKKTITQRRQELDLQRRKISFWFPPFHSHDGIDEGTDPIDDPEPEPGTQKMLLGRILEFDSPLSFDPSPIRRNLVESVGEIRLTKPGNRTEVGGSARWERVLQHEFTLIVRGVIKYQLPLSSITKSAKIGSRIKVAPGGDSPDPDRNGSDSSDTLLLDP